MKITFVSTCGEFEGQLEELRLSTGVSWYLVTNSWEAYKFIGNLKLLAVCSKLKMSALIYGECHQSSYGLKKLEVIELKPVFEYELNLASDLQSPPKHQKTDLLGEKKVFL